MKRTYLQPLTTVEFAQCEMLLAASRLDATLGEQGITPSNDEYTGEFAVKSYSFGDDFGD